MATMVDYLAWRGDLDFAERPFNDVDALVLGTLSYVDFSGVVPGAGEGGIRLADAAEALLRRADGNLAPYVRSMASIKESFLEGLARSRRFGDLWLTTYADEVDDSISLQFAALTVDLTGRGVAVGGRSVDAYVSFRGTDLSLAGWQEDFMLGFTITRAQTLARAYLRDALQTYGGVLVGGHSKGGNLVSYATATVGPKLAEGIVRAWSLDGPGMDESLMAKGPHDALGPRFVRLQPAYSVVGQLFDRPETPRTYVRSDASGLAQHDPMTWQVSRDSLAEAEGLEPAAKVVNESLASWLAGMGMAEREALTTELFEVLEAGGATDLNELVRPESLQKVLAAAGSVSPRTKDLMGRLVEANVNGARAAVGKAVLEARDAAGQAAADFAQGAVGRVGAEAREITGALSDFVATLPVIGHANPEPEGAADDLPAPDYISIPQTLSSGGDALLSKGEDDAAGRS